MPVPLLSPTAARPYSLAQTRRGWREHLSSVGGASPLEQGPMPRRCFTYGVMLDTIDQVLAQRFREERLSAVDLGCSNGNLWVALRASSHFNRFDLNAAEIDEGAVATAQANFSNNGIKVDLRQQDLSQRLPYSDQSMHFVTMTHVVTEMPKDILEYALSEVRRISRPNGLFFVEMLDPSTYSLSLFIRAAIRETFGSDQYNRMADAVNGGKGILETLLSAYRTINKTKKLLAKLQADLPQLPSIKNEADAKAMLADLMRIGLLYPQSEHVSAGEAENYRIYLPGQNIVDLPHYQRNWDEYLSRFFAEGFNLNRVVVYSPAARHIDANPPLRVLKGTQFIRVVVLDASRA